ncbi:hypothetical protein EVAR_954_1 [Eumeta japonica]|uniref:Uncharacterized protein n=1 Tax=Eumeta variegata TaxID=151549 RepID=A0A4C1SE89_EUMVA|nr:hypothetical protein EVAR_954_1 [Eumeta japonica]
MENSRKKVMHSQARGVIATVYQRMKFEAENGVERNRCEVAHFKSCGSKRKNRYKNFEAKRKVIQLARC